MKKTIITLAISLSISSISAEELEPFDIVGLDEINSVLTATNRKQAKRDAPGSVSKITREQIKRFNIKTIVEALQHIPGMNAFNFDGSTSYVGYRGSNFPEPRRMELLIDGVSFLRGDLQRIDWLSLPINLEDIYTIEVFRGPNAHTFGPNAFLAVVNITTLHPKQTQGVSASITKGSLDTSNVFVRYSGKVSDNGAFRFSIGKRENDGFDKNEANLERQDSSDTTIATYYYTHEFDNYRLDLQGGLVKTDSLQEPFFAQSQIFPVTDNGDSYYNRIRWVGELNKDHLLTVQASGVYNKHDINYEACFPALLLTNEMRALNTSNPNYANTLLAGGFPSGGTEQDDLLLGGVFQQIGALGGAESAFTPLCGNANNSVKDNDVHFKIQSDTIFSENFMTTQGFEVKRTRVFSETYMGQNTVEEKSYRLFGNAEYRRDSYLLNIGGMFVDTKSEGNSFLPRAALNYHLNNEQTLRFIVSKAERVPSVFENSGNWSHEVSNLNPVLPNIGDTATFFLTSKIDGSVKSEKITSYEIGYYADFGSATFDMKLFKDDMTSLVTEIITLQPAFNPTNKHSSTLTGVEIETHYFSEDRNFELWAAYAYVNVDATTPIETYLSPKNSGNIFAAWHVNDSWTTSAGIYAHDGISSGAGPGDLDYQRAELNINRSIKVGNGVFDFTLSLQHRLDSHPELIDSNNYDNKTHYFFTISYTNE